MNLPSGRRSASQGQSAATIDKERRLGSAITVGMKIANHKFSGRGFRYWHLDANSGSGWNETVDVPGSPLVFWQAAHECLTGMEPAPFFCDRNPSAMVDLQRRLRADQVAAEKSVLLPGDNEEALEVFAERIRMSERPAFAVGSLLIDPNGYFYRRSDGSGVPIAGLHAFCREFPRIDVILNLNMRTYVLQLAQGHGVMAPTPLLDSLCKRQWLVARTGGQSRFLLAIGRNVTTGDHQVLGLHDRSDQIGRQIMLAAVNQQQIGLELGQPLSRLSRASSVQSSSGRVYAAHERPVRLRSEGHRGAPPPLPTVGDVRPAVEPPADLSRLPLFGARKG